MRFPVIVVRLIVPLNLIAADIAITGSAKQAMAIELYTSHVLHSCPPAETYGNRLLTMRNCGRVIPWLERLRLEGSLRQSDC